MSDFSDRPFFAGSLTGIRSFKVDQMGRLTGVSYTRVFTPGENIAECLKDERASGGILPTMWTSLLYAPTYSFSPTMNLTFNTDEPTTAHEVKPEVQAEKALHRVGQLKCTCGYYAYFDDDKNPYHDGLQVAALIEGYGVTTVGLRGFRCEKARLRALIIKPPKGSVTLHNLVRRNYPDVPVFTSKQAAVTEFPLTPQDPPLPESVPDFWTRSA